MIRRIVIVTDAWHPQVNGVVRVLGTIKDTLQARGIEVIVVEPTQFKTIAFPTYREIRLALFPRRKLARLLLEAHPDAVHIATEGPLGLAARRVCRRRKIPFTTSYHTHFQLHLEARMGSTLTQMVTAYLRWFHRAAVRTMVATSSLESELEADGFAHLALWPFGVDLDLFKRSEKSDFLNLEKPVCMYVGRVAVEKNVEEFLQLDLPGSKVVVGDGPERARLEKRFPKAHFVGYKHGKELSEYYSSADVLVFPSRSETFGLIVLEALACGTPVVAHDVMGPRDIITDGVDGCLGEDLQAATLKCLSANIYPDVCRAKAVTYSWEHSTDVFLENLVQI